MKIVYLHGLESNIDQKDPKIIFLNNNFNEVFTPTINYKDKNTFARLFSKIKAINPDLIVGSSMGGYFAYLIGSKLGIETLLFNPAVIDRAFNPVVDDTNLSGAKHNVFLGKSDNVISGEGIKSYFSSKGVGSFKYNSYKGGHRVSEDTFINSIKNTVGIREGYSNQIYKKRKSIKMKYIKSIELTAESKKSELKVNEGMMSELDLMAKEAKSFSEFLKDVFSIPEYIKHKGKREVEKFLKDFYISANESVNEAALTIPGMAAMLLSVTIAAKIGLMSDKKYSEMVGSIVPTAKSIIKHIPIIGKKIKDQELKDYQTSEVEKYLKDEITDKDIVDILNQNPELKKAIEDIAKGGMRTTEYYKIIKQLGGAADKWGTAHGKFKKLRKKIADGNVLESVTEGKLNEFTDLEILGFLTKSKENAMKNKLPKLVKNLQKHIKNLEKKIKLSKTIPVLEAEDPMSSLLQSFEKAMTDKKAYAAIVAELEGAPDDVKPKIMRMADEFIPAKTDGILELIDELESGEIDPEDIGANETKEVLIQQFKQFIKVTEFAIKTIKKHVNESIVTVYSKHVRTFESINQTRR